MNTVETKKPHCSHVWLTRTLINSQELLSFVCDQQFDDRIEYVAMLRKFKSGQDLNTSELPDVMWPSVPQHDRRKKLPHIFSANGFLVISEQLANVLHKFNLGQSKLVPVQFVHRNRTPFLGAFFFFHIRERKLGFEPDHSARYTPKKFEDQSHKGSMPADLRDDDISVNPSVCVGSDVWCDDSLLRSLFFSERAMAAMRDAKLLNHNMVIANCPITTVH